MLFFDRKKYSCIIAIGDIHGEISCLKQLLAKLRKKYHFKKVQFIFQELTDRGENSRLTIEYLIKFQKQFPQTIFIQSNHDLLNSRGQAWGMRNNISAVLDYPHHQMWMRHQEFLRHFKPYYEAENFIFLHGGLPAPYSHPKNCPLDQLVSSYDVNKNYTGEKTVVMGHTPHKKVTSRPKTLFIDTGVYKRSYGHLSAVILDDHKGEVIDSFSQYNERLKKH